MATALIVALYFACCGTDTHVETDTLVEVESVEVVYPKEAVGWSEPGVGDAFIIMLPGGLSIEADFQLPEEPFFAISNIVFDAESRRWAVLYATTESVSQIIDGESMPFFGGRQGRLNIQLFDPVGAFIGRIQTEFNPRTESGGAHQVGPSGPVTFNNGLLTFSARMAGAQPRYFVFFDVDTEEYTYTRAGRVVAIDDYFLTVAVLGDDEFVMRLFERDRLISEIQVDATGHLVPLGIASVKDFDPVDRVGTFGVGQAIFTLDFNRRTWEFHRHYRREDIHNPGAPFAHNERWAIHHPSLFNPRGTELIALDRNTGSVAFLTVAFTVPRSGTAVGASSQIRFGPDNLLLVNHMYRLELIDVENAVTLDSMFGVDYGAMDAFATGIAYDSEREWFLVTWRSPQQGETRLDEMPLMMDIFTLEGELVHSFDTGFITHPLTHHHNIAHHWIRLDGEGNADISYAYLGSASIPGSPHQLGTVRYWR